MPAINGHLMLDSLNFSSLGYFAAFNTSSSTLSLACRVLINVAVSRETNVSRVSDLQEPYLPAYEREELAGAVRGAIIRHTSKVSRPVT